MINITAYTRDIKYKTNKETLIQFKFNFSNVIPTWDKTDANKRSKGNKHDYIEAQINNYYTILHQQYSRNNIVTIIPERSIVHVVHFERRMALNLLINKRDMSFEINSMLTDCSRIVLNITSGNVIIAFSFYKQGSIKLMIDFLLNNSISFRREIR